MPLTIIQEEKSKFKFIGQTFKQIFNNIYYIFFAMLVIGLLRPVTEYYAVIALFIIGYWTTEIIKLRGRQNKTE